jgi:UDP-2,3-diacylglucosamine pyrophosphatase LpxH
VRTLIISDLHLGSRTGSDVLRHPGALGALLAELPGVERLVLLGDVLELRHGPVTEALGPGLPVLRAIAEALGPDAEVVVVPGNHDHALVAPWLEQRATAGATTLELEESVPAAEAGPVAAVVADALGADRTRIAYPGVWLREDVYATHGHYLDRHITVPTFERLAVGAMSRVARRDGLASPADYEAHVAPLYAFLHLVARYTRTGHGRRRQAASAGAWKTLSGRGRRPWRGRGLALAFPLAVRLANRLGIGPLRTDVSGAELRRAGVRAMGEVVGRLGIEAEHVVFGHTHRAGPKKSDDRSEWQAPTGARLWNTGCWVYDSTFLASGGNRNPYWPGPVIELEAEGPPRRRNLLHGWSRETVS